MARTPQSPRIADWRGKPYLFYFDFATGKRVRKCVDSMPVKERRETIRRYTVDYRERQAQSLRGYVEQTAFDTKLIDSLQRFVDDVEERVKVRQNNPDSREGLASSSAYELKLTLSRFTSWLEENGRRMLTTGALGAHDIHAFIRVLAGEKTKHGERKVKRSGNTLNKHRRNVATALSWLNDARPRLFPDYDHLRRACKVQRVDPPEPRSFSPAELVKFYDALKRRESAEHTKVVEDKRRGKWIQSARATCATPQSLLFILCGLTGARLGEVLHQKWEDVDLDTGRVTIRDKKTGKRRVLPLVGAAEGTVAPKLLDELKRMKLKAGNRVYVLPHAEPTEKNPDPAPVHVRKAWTEVGEAIGLREVTPQSLRQSFVAYLASIGVPEDVASLWCGHSPDIARRYYRSQVLERNRGDSVEEAMGLDAVFEAEPVDATKVG